jgi:ubiquinone/menaquinone biosynthesis C-methylase UbiE
MQWKDHFSHASDDYRRWRPRYPAALFAWLGSVSPSTALAWDCATGNGQAALGLASPFERVVATDRSDEQIRHAHRHPRIEYRVASAEASGLEAGSVDLVTVAAAAHWFEPEPFAHELARVVRPGGVLAAFTYHLAHVAPPFDEPFGWLYWTVLKPYFAPATRYVDERYETLPLPGSPIPAPAFEVTAEWSLDEALAFVGTWSGAATYRDETGDDPIERIRPALTRAWGNASARRTLRWPLFLRVQRL